MTHADPPSENHEEPVMARRRGSVTQDDGAQILSGGRKVVVHQVANKTISPSHLSRRQDVDTRNTSSKSSRISSETNDYAALLREELNTNPVREQCHSLAAKLVADRNTKQLSVIQFTGLATSRECSWTSLLLAATIADSFGKRTLLIDTVGGEKSVTETCGLRGKQGFAQILSSDAAISQTNQKCNLDNLTLVPAGVNAPSHVHEAGIQNLKFALGVVSNDYDFVFMHTGAEAEEPAHDLAGVCDRAYLLVDIATTNFLLVQQAADRLNRSGARLGGCVAIQGKAA